PRLDYGEFADLPPSPTMPRRWSPPLEGEGGQRCGFRAPQGASLRQASARPDALVLKPFPSRGGWVGMVSMLIVQLQRLPAAHREHHSHPGPPLEGTSP